MIRRPRHGLYQPMGLARAPMALWLRLGPQLARSGQTRRLNAPLTSRFDDFAGLHRVVFVGAMLADQAARGAVRGHTAVVDLAGWVPAIRHDQLAAVLAGMPPCLWRFHAHRSEPRSQPTDSDRPG